jgi:acetyl-CoA carboxylase carboxyltransferase component
MAKDAIANPRVFSTVPSENPVFLRDPSLIKLKFKERLASEREQARIGGGLARISKQHERGSLTARERLELLFDQGSFQEVDQLKAHRCTEFGMDEKKFPGDGIVTGHGLVNGRHVYAFSQGTSHEEDAKRQYKYYTIHVHLTLNHCFPYTLFQ